jgi:meso-butanediol dehydrogenase/(S,S)-butanediol dehydrogenase/diacetyl reductase
MIDLSGKVAFVTGGGRGLGRGICQALAETGATVMVSDVVAPPAEETATILKESGANAAAIAADVTSEASLKTAIDAAVSQFGRIDILVNNAGVIYMQDVLEIPVETWEKTFDVNVKGLFLASKLVAQQMIAQGGGGAIVNIASNAGKVGFGSMADYNASKAAVINLTRTMATEFAPHNINVNAVCPGAVETPMLLDVAQWIVGESGDDAEALMRSFAPPQIGRLIQPVEVGRVVAFLASEAATIIRGQSINVDAGSTPY